MRINYKKEKSIFKIGDNPMDFIMESNYDFSSKYERSSLFVSSSSLFLEVFQTHAKLTARTINGKHILQDIKNTIEINSSFEENGITLVCHYKKINDGKIGLMLFLEQLVNILPDYPH